PGSRAPASRSPPERPRSRRSCARPLHDREQLFEPRDLRFDGLAPRPPVAVGANGGVAADLVEPALVALVRRLALQELLVRRARHVEGALAEVELGERRREERLGGWRSGRR